MCGICGYYSKRRIPEDALRTMNDTMIHRGPDDSGVELYDAGEGRTVGLAHRRLSIIDLSPLGHQPMHSADGRLTVVFNGEIYNYPELKKELSEYPFKSTSDTEAILAAWLKWGPEALARLNGMFAFAVYDRREKTLFLTRDRIGKKPLYYWYDGDGIVFASELKPIMACPGFVPKIRRDVLSRYLFQQYINAPETIFEDVRKLEPGALLRFSPEKKGEERLRTEKYWDIKEVCHRGEADPVRDYKEAKDGLKEFLVKAVRGRMIADVPLGCFLSGGYDSSLVSAIAQSVSDAPLKTFSIGFSEKQYDEAGYARAVAEHLGTDHTELYIDEPQMFELVDSIPKYFDEPFADSSQIPTMLVSMLARQRVTVALSGDGGDEFFCGYGIYENVRQAQLLDAAGAAAHALGALPAGRGRRLVDRYPFRVRVIAANRDPETKTQFGAGSYVRIAERFPLLPEGAPRLPTGYPVESRYEEKNWQVRRMLLDMDTYLPGDILCKVDRASMKYSLESRCPILDRDVMEYSFRIPHAFKFRRGEKKAILKDIAYDYIPRELLERPKTGFGVPLDKWLRGPLRQELEDVSSREYLASQGLFDPDYVSSFVADYLMTGDGGPASGANYSKMCWSFLVFQQWYGTYMKKF